MKLVTAVLVLSMGCGLTRVHGPAPGRPVTERPVCTSSDHLLRVDAAFGATGVLLTLVGAAVLGAESADEDVGAALLVGGLVLTSAMLVSSGIGYARVKKCRAAIEDFQRSGGGGAPSTAY